MIALPTFRGALAGFNPLSLAPALWLNDTGSDPSVWTDLSGNGRNAVQATGANQPSIVTGALNGRQVRRFDGTDDRLIPPDFSLDNHTIFSVVKPDLVDPTTASTIFCIGATSASARDAMNYFSRTGSSTIFSTQRSTGVGFPTTSSSATNLSFQITTGKYTGTELIGYINNGLRNSVAANNTGSSENKPSVGATIQLAGTSFFLKGDLAELIVYPSSLSDANCLRVEKYLSNKYSIAIA
jgi:hypothetical protein